MQKLVKELYSGDEVVRPTDREAGALGKYLRAAIAVAAPLLYACGGGSGSIANPNAIPTSTGGKVTVSGVISGRMSGEPISGCQISYRNKSDGSIAKAVAAGGTYEIRDLPGGSYEVSIDNCDNVPNVTQNVDVTGGNMPFSVIRWNSQKDGVVYDAYFAEYFNWVARGKAINFNKVKKWATPPTEIYIDQASFGTLSSDAQGEFLDILNEVNRESIPGMFCGRVGPLPINIGPVTTNNGLAQYRNGAMMILFNSGTGSGASPQVDSNGIITASMANYSSQAFGNGFRRDEIKSLVAHELFHNVFASHAYGHGYENGLMDGNNRVTEMSPQEKLAACIVNHSDTKPGNTAPDTNPSYR